MPDGGALKEIRAETNRAMSQAILTVDLGAVAANWRALADRAQGAECAAVVKADAYGLGLAPVAKALFEAAAAPFSSPISAKANPCALWRRNARIFVLNGLAPTASALYARSKLDPRARLACRKSPNGPIFAATTARAIPRRSISTPG